MMRTYYWSYKVVTIVITLSLLLQMGVPITRAVPAQLRSQESASLPTATPSNLLAPLADVGFPLPANGIPEGLLIDGNAGIQSNPTQPTLLSHPLSVSRVQSAYTPSQTLTNTLILTFTVTNNLPPTLVPALSPTDTPTDTLNILASFDPAADVNTIRNVVLANVLTNNATYQTASPTPDSQNNAYLFNLGDIPPLQTVTATLTVEVPTVVGTIIELDEGATAYGTLFGQMLTFQTSAAVLAPDSFAGTLAWTPDANIYDEYMLHQTAQLGTDPLNWFSFVRSLGYSSYEGSLRGTRGTLWSEAGNALDLSSLLVAMLRANGVPARYVRGTLNTSNSQQLILSMFPEKADVAGYVPAGTETADPANDPQLLSETQDHWWVQAYIAGNWLDLDPSFDTAQAGDSFTTVNETWTEIPDNLRHKVTLQLKVESYNPFAANLSGFHINYPLTVTLNSVSLVGKSVTLLHIVSTEALGGLIFTTYIHSYAPNLVIGNYEEVIQGEVYQDILSNFPFGSSFATGIWLTVESTSPDGSSESYIRELKDIVGPAARQGTGTITVTATDNRPDASEPLLSNMDVMQLHVYPQSNTPRGHLQKLTSELVQLGAVLQTAQEQLVLLSTEDTILATQYAEEHLPWVLLGQLLALDGLGTQFQVLTSESAETFQTDELWVASYPDHAKTILLTQTAISDTLTTSFELLNVRERAIAYPGQAANATQAANLIRSISDKVVEYNLLQTVFGQPPESALAILQQATSSGIALVAVNSGALSLLDGLAISDEAKGRITAAVYEGKTVYVPGQMVDMGGSLQIGWLEVDASGYATFTSEDGSHAALTAEEAVIISALITAVFGLIVGGIAALAAIASALIAAFAAIVVAIIAAVAGGDAPVRLNNLPQPLRPGSSGLLAIEGTLLPALLQSNSHTLAQCASGQSRFDCTALVEMQGGLNLAVAAVASQVPLPPLFISQHPDSVNETTSQQFVTTLGTVASDQLQIDVTTPMVMSSHSDPATSNWDSAGQTAWVVNSLAVSDAVLLETGTGDVMSAGTFTLTTSSPVLITDSSPQISLESIGSSSFFAPASAGLAGGSEWQNFSATLSNSQPYTLTINDTTLSIENSLPLTGSFTLVVTGTATLLGAGQTAMPTFGASMQLQGQENHLTIAPATGTFLAGGQPVDLTHGIAVVSSNNSINLSTATSNSDQLELDGTANFFTFDFNSTTSTTTPDTPVTFTVEIAANFDETYIFYVTPPTGWSATIDTNGLVSLQPPLGATPNAYEVFVAVQSATYPDLVLSAVHTVTTTALESMALSVTALDDLTSPMGLVLNGDTEDYLGRSTEGSGQQNSGQAQISEAAYKVAIENRSTISHTFDLSVTGLPAGWLILGGTESTTSMELTVPAGSTGYADFYVSPPPNALLPTGTSYLLTVEATATENPTLQESTTVTFAMPGLAFPYLQLQPTFSFVAPDSQTELLLTVQNVGNSAGTFTLTNTLQSNPYFGSSSFTQTLPITPTTLNTPSLADGNSISYTVQIDTTGATVGAAYLLTSATESGGYLPRTHAAILIVSPEASCAYAASELADALGELLLAETLWGLGQSIDGFVGDLSNLGLRDDLVADLVGAIGLLEDVPAQSLLQTVANNLQLHTDPPDFSNDLADLCTALDQLIIELEALLSYAATVQWAPTNDAILLGDTATYSLTISSQGTLSATYGVTLTLPTGTTFLTTTLAAGQSVVLPQIFTPTQFGFELLRADLVYPPLSLLIDSSSAGLNVVDKFIQLLAVNPVPAFVETGVSSTTLSIEVANIANIPQEATAHVEILASTGNISYTNDLRISILTGDPRTYELTSVDTSGWAAGLYTVTVDLLDENTLLIPDGSNYGYLAVGQGLGATQSLSNQLFPPGTLTVTTTITTEILQETILPLAPQPPLDWHFAGIPQSAPDIEETVQSPTTALPELDIERAEERVGIQMTGSISRTENNNAAITYTGSWTHVTSSTADRASAGTYHSSTTAGNTASFTFTGQWLSVGFATSTSNGIVEIAIDGIPQGQFDLYSRANDTASYHFNVISGTHTLLVTVTGLKNSFSSNDTILLDYIDVWDGTTLPSGTFEQDDPRVALSDNWTTATNAIASGGSYLRNGETAWFAFTDDSITLQTIADGNGETIKISIDGVFKGYYNLDSFDVVTRTFSFENLGTGPHTLEVRAYRSEPTIDAFFVPAISPETPPTLGDFHRYEENDPAILYNGFPYTTTKTSWTISSEWITSRGYIANSQTTNDNVALTFNGTTVAVGFMTSSDSGRAELFIDGVSQGVLDLYSRSDDAKSFYYRGLSAGTHTLTLNLLGTKHPNSSNELVYLDYIDVWSGTNLPNGTFEESDSRVIRNNVWWERTTSTVASGGYYYYNFVNGPVTAWFPFTGDSFTYQAIADLNGSTFLELTIDGQPQGYLNLYNPSPITRTFSYEGLGVGLHVAQLQYRTNYLTLDAFHTPAIEPGIQPVTTTGIVRYEEYDSALRYNGYEYPVRPTSWNTDYLVQASNLYLENSSTAGNTISLDFTGEWVNLAFRTRSNGGTGQIFVDGTSYGTMNFLTSSEGFTSTQVSLVNGFHTVSVTVVSGNVWLDYIDVWDGSSMSDEFVNANLLQPTGRTHYSGSWYNVSDPNSIEEDYIRVSLNNAIANSWYSFTGDSFTFYAFSRNTTIHANVYVDGQLIENVSLDYDFSEQPLAFHYTGFSYGAHDVRIGNGNATRIDGFASNPTELVNYRPLIEWYNTTPAGNGAPFAGTFGVIVPIAVGDVNEDGIVELVVAGDISISADTLYLYRGDGQDTGDGDPILWSVTGFGDDIGTPAIADLDGNPGAEIVFASNNGLFALYNDGTTYWSESTFSGNLVRATPALGNLDADPQPEIVINMDDTLAVYEHDGTLAWSHTFAFESGHPLLADLTGDGVLDIVIVDWDDNVYLYDYNFGTPSLVWTVSVASSFDALFGSPAIADIDGLQPAGDSNPEIALTSNGLVTVLNHDGTTLWATPIGTGVPGGVSIADIDGDGEVEIVTGTRYDDGIGEGRVYALNADGSLLWSAAAYDSTSANSTSVLDLDGDGVYEIAWNGKETGLTIFNGADGSMLFNEPLIYSHTATDYPAIVDVDLDGYAEVVVPNLKGVAVLGWDQVWSPSRSVWNQHTYHITNINDDLTVPESEPNSWELHNTYRTQTPEANGLPNYRVTITYTRGISEVTVLTDTFSLSVTESDPNYRWAYQQPWYRPTFTTTFASEVANLRPGEVRQVSQGTEVLYTLPSGTNQLLLPPMYVTAGHLIAIDPAVATGYAGSSATYTVTLFNLSALPDTYTLSVAGLPAEWVTLPLTVSLPADGQTTIPLLVNIPQGTESESVEFAVMAETTAGINDQAGALLEVIDGLDVAILPSERTATAGQPVTYTVTVTNNLAVGQMVALSSSGNVTVEMPASLNLSTSSSQTFPITVTGTTEGASPFTVTGLGFGSDSDIALLNVIGSLGITLDITPETASAGLGSLIAYTVTMTNAGTLTDTYTLTANLPPAWSAQFLVNGAPVTELSLNPSLFNSGDVVLLVEVPTGISAGSYSLMVTATSQRDATITTTDTAIAIVDTLGVGVQILPALLTTLAPTDAGNWSVQVTNNGSVADTFDLAVGGVFASLATFTPSSVILNPGQSQIVQLTTQPFLSALPQSYLLQVIATSTTNADVLDVDSLTVTFTNYTAVDVEWLPDSQTADGTTNINYVLVLTNTGNVPASVNFNGSTFDGLTGELSINSLTIAPHLSVVILVTISAQQEPGTYTLVAMANAGTTSDSDLAELIIIGVPTALHLQTAHPIPNPSFAPWLWLMTLASLLTLLALIRRRPMRN